MRNETSEALIRSKTFDFLGSEGRDDEIDVYQDGGSTRICVAYADAGEPDRIWIEAPAVGIHEIQIQDETGATLEGDALEALLYELIDGDRLVERMTGHRDDLEDLDPA